jgi:hypothetical protein
MVFHATRSTAKPACALLRAGAVEMRLHRGVDDKRAATHPFGYLCFAGSVRSGADGRGPISMGPSLSGISPGSIALFARRKIGLGGALHDWRPKVGPRIRLWHRRLRRRFVLSLSLFSSRRRHFALGLPTSSLPIFLTAFDDGSFSGMTSPFSGSEQ